MKLFLTSAGLSNQKLSNALVKLTGLANDKIKIAFIPTASNVEEGDKGWMINDYINLKKQGFKSIDIVDISALQKNIWLPRLKFANVLFFGGGNTFHLMYWVKKSGLSKLLPDLLKTRIYAGISAGSCIAGPTIYNSVQNLFGEKYELKIEKGLSLADFQFIPHLNSAYFPKIRDKYLKLAATNLKEPVYALDDNSAIVVEGKKVKVISTGTWRKYN